MVKWHLEKRKVSELKNWEKNPRTISEKAFKELEKSVDALGNFEPLVINIDGTVIAGNQRLRLEMKKGDNEVDVYVPERELSEEEIKKIGVISNRHSGEWDMDILANEFEDILKGLGYKYFIELDDDYNIFAYKFNSNYDYIQKWILSLDDVFSAMIEYFETAGITCLAMAQNGDFIGGRDSWIAKGLNIKRKAMNTLICSTERKFEFVGRVNEDVNTYVLLGSRGKLFIQIPLVVINQQKSQKSKGGMTDVYLDSGTYLKSFYSVMYAPSSVKISLMGDKHKRIHHRINWDSAVPKILRENDA